VSTTPASNPLPPVCNPLPTQAELRTFLDDYELGALLAFHPGRRGRRGRVVTEQGVFWLVGPGMTDRFLEALLDHLNTRAQPVPSVVRGRDGAWIRPLGAYPGALVRWPEGRHLVHFTAEDCARVGDLLGRIHQACEDFTHTREPHRSHRWRRESIEALGSRLCAEDQALLREELRFQGLYRFGDLPQGIVHGAPNRRRLVFDNAGQVGLTGFGHACRHALLLDVAVAVNDCCAGPDGRLDRDLSRALLNAYHALRLLRAIERGAWPVLLRQAALDAWLERLQLAHDGAVARDHLAARIAEESSLQRHWAS